MEGRAKGHRNRSRKTALIAVTVEPLAEVKETVAQWGHWREDALEQDWLDRDVEPGDDADWLRTPKGEAL